MGLLCPYVFSSGHEQLVNLVAEMRAYAANEIYDASPGITTRERLRFSLSPSAFDRLQLRSPDQVGTEVGH